MMSLALEWTIQQIELRFAWLSLSRRKAVAFVRPRSRVALRRKMLGLAVRVAHRI